MLKAFVRLGYGRNEITLKTDNCSLKIVLYRYLINPVFRPITCEKSLSRNEAEPLQLNNKVVRVLYVICKNDPTIGEFQSTDTVPNKILNALKRISLNVELLQTFISEMIFKVFKTRKTFALKKDFLVNGHGESLVCEPFYTSLDLEKALQMSQDELFVEIAKEIRQDKLLYDQNAKYLAILSFTRYKPIADSLDTNTSSGSNDIFKDVHGYCALGIKI